MAEGLENYPNIDAPDTDYPNGKIRDNPGDFTGTPFNTLVYGDTHQLHAKLLRQAGITANGLPDNEYSGNQYFEATKKNFNKYGVSKVFTDADEPFTIPIDGEGPKMFNALIIIAPGTTAGSHIYLPNFEVSELDTVTIVNDSAGNQNVLSSTYAFNHNVPSPTAQEVLASGKTMEVTFINIGGQFNWIITKKP